MTDAEAARRILVERARALAEVGEQGSPSESTELLVLEVGHEAYGVDVRDVAGIEAVPRVAPVPGAPPSWAGVVNLRGTLYPVLDGARYLVAERDQERSRIALLSADATTVALLVGGVAGVRRVATDDIRTSASGTPPWEAVAVRGVTSDLLPVLDVRALLAETGSEAPEASQGGQRW